MIGRGVSGGAVSVLNAIPCGIGSTIGIGLRTEAEISPADSVSATIADRPGMDSILVRTCVRRTLEAVGETLEGYSLTVRSEIPPSMGLKSSSSACNATVFAVLDLLGCEMDPLDAIRIGVRCARECGVTITGAFDDACGCGLGGLVVTDNSKDELLLRREVPRMDAVLCIPDRSIPKSSVPVGAYRSMEAEYREMASRISEDYLSVLTRNGAAVGALAGADAGIARRALELGALAAGTTGTGPAVAVLAEPGDGPRIAGELGCRTIITETRRHGHGFQRRDHRRICGGSAVEELHPQGDNTGRAVRRALQGPQSSGILRHRGDRGRGPLHGGPGGAHRRRPRDLLRRPPRS